MPPLFIVAGFNGHFPTDHARFMVSSGHADGDKMGIKTFGCGQSMFGNIFHIKRCFESFHLSDLLRFSKTVINELSRI